MNTDMTISPHPHILPLSPIIHPISPLVLVGRPTTILPTPALRRTAPPARLTAPILRHLSTRRVSRRPLVLRLRLADLVVRRRDVQRARLR